MAAEPRQLLSEFVVDHLQDLVLKTEDVREMLDDLADFTALTLSDPAIDFCSITLIRHKKPVTVASSERGAARLDETQYAAGEGPCLTAIREQAPIHVHRPDLVREHRWPAYRLAVRISQLAEAKTHLAAAMESRTVIDLAAGAIMAQNRCSQESAMKILKIASQTRNAKLRDVAASVVASLSQDPKVHTHFDA
jgi:hypothetical protein